MRNILFTQKKFLLVALFATLLTSSCGKAGLNIASDSQESSSTVENSNNTTDNSVDNSDNSVNFAEDEDQPDSSESDEDGENPECSSEILGVDGPGDFLWKNEGVDGRPVILFPDEYDVKFEKVLVERTSGDLEEAKYTGFSNGNRQHWRLSRDDSEYVGKILVQDADQECVWEIDDTESRQD